ncbi:MAG: hypothetical protein WEB00_07955 [Dehalococcoidia bacterium]
MEEFGIDLEEVFRVIDTAEVLVIRFTLIDNRLLLDARDDADKGPILTVVPKATSLEERFRTIKKLRPGLPLPERIMSFQWPRQVGTLRNSGIWERLRERCAAGEADDEMCARAWRELAGAERRLVELAISGGQGFQTIWERA